MADKEFEFQYVENPEESAWGIIGRGVASFNRQQVGENNFQRLCYVVQAPDQEIVGGVLGETYFDWLFIELLWVKEEFRGRGYGHHLLRLAEELARERGAKNVYLDTFSFQAPEFYKKRGYQVFGELAEFPPGHRRLFLTKPL
jgi:ribosomal protein S18 acetylase RimI-like enzyme